MVMATRVSAFLSLPLPQVAPQVPPAASPACLSGVPFSPLRATRLSSLRPLRLPVLGAAQSIRRCFVRAGSSELTSAGGFWKDPDDGYGSEGEGWGEENEELETEANGGEVVVEKNNASFSAASESENLRRDAELLLNSEEKEILWQNEVPNLSRISSRKWKPFHTRALSGQIPYLDVLLKYGIDIDAPDEDGLTALHKTVISKKETATCHLLRKGANPHVRDKDGATLLHYAVQVGAMQTVKLLIKYKVDVNIADIDGWTPLHLAIQSRSRDIAKVLLINGADQSRRNKDGKTPLDLSLCYGKDFKSYELAKLLKLVPANRDL